MNLMNLKVKLSLKVKIFLSVGLFYLAAVGTLTYLTIRSQRNLLLAEMVERAKAGINLMELSVTGALYKLDTFRLETIAREAKALPDVDYAYIFDDKGRIVGDFHEDQSQLFSTFTDELGKKILESEDVLVNIRYQKDILDISKPVNLGHQKLGGIRLGFNLNPMIEEMRMVVLRALGISTAIFVVGLVVIFVITMRMTKPIERLTLAAKRIEDGDLQHRVSIERDDEIGTLATAFDQMAERLMQREKELKESQNTLRRADRLSSLGLLTAGLAHEIRNPLVAIRTFTQLLPERYNDAEFREGFQGLALKEVDRICGLINDLLSFARPSRPNVAHENMNDIVEGITRILETEAKEKGVEIVRNFGANLPKVWIDREQMKQVFMNLILNAIQAMKEGGSIFISTRLNTTHEIGKAARFLQIEIRDTGVGIPEENLDHIFDPFFTSKDEGSGLGLSISHQIVQEHGGYVTVQSKVGKGTSFFVNIPVGKPVRPSGNGRAHANEANPSH
ncbi:MAG TPA: ATP-binding protein [Candidatus Binatia bacterium]|nr:ATP-binding protein [Candidatus Binatia bacterium]